MWKQDPNDPSKWKQYRRVWNREKRAYDEIEVKSRKQYTNADTAQVRVRCSGHLHTISFTPHSPSPPGKKPRYGGRFTVHHHDREDMVLETAMARLGDGHKIRCLIVRDAWIGMYEKHYYHYGWRQRRLLPTELKRMMKDVISPQEAQRRRLAYKLEAMSSRGGPISGVDPLSIPLVRRKERIVLSIARRELQKSRYFPLRKSPSQDEVSISPTDGYYNIPDITGQPTYMGGRALFARINIDSWFKLYRMGASLVEDLFIAGEASEKHRLQYPVEKNQWLVYAGRPGDVRLYASLAVIELEGKTWKLVKWVMGAPYQGMAVWAWRSLLRLLGGRR